MKKLLIAHNLHALLRQNNSFLDRADITVFTAASNEEALRIHRREHADLIITQIDLPGMSSEQLCSLIREDAGLRGVQVIMVCTNRPGEIEKCSRCGVNAVILRPVNPALLLAKAQQVLSLSSRETARVPLGINVTGTFGSKTFPCRAKDISASGMLIETEAVAGQGDRIACSFSLPGSKQIEVSADIVRIIEKAPGDRANRYSVKFADLSPEARQALQAFVGGRSTGALPGVV